MPKANTKLARSRLEALLSMASSSVAEPAAGLSGLYGLFTGGLNKGVDNIERTRSALTYQPRDPQGQQELAQTLAPITTRLDALKNNMGDTALRKTGSPGMATAAYMVPDTLMTLLGARGAGVKGPKLSQIAERSAGPGMGSPVSQIGAINAWHGSPHDFDRFSMDRIGTGEGNQAYGRGLYFAGNKDVARQYAASVKDMGAVQTANQRMSELAREMARYEKPGSYGHYNDPRGYELKAEYDALMGGRHETLQKPGNVYDVELAPDETDLLDWDAPLSQQPEKVRAALEAGGITADMLADYQRGWANQSGGEGWGDLASMTSDAVPDPNQYLSGLTGRDIYGGASLGKAGGLTAATASARLRALGIPGIRYLDGGSRAAGDGSRNYVMFDDSLVKIRGKE